MTLELENHIQGVIHLQLSSMKFILKIKFGPERVQRVHWINTNAAALAFLKSITFPPHYTVFKSNEIYWYRLYNKQFIKILHKLLISTPPQKKKPKNLVYCNWKWGWTWKHKLFLSTVYEAWKVNKHQQTLQGLVQGSVLNKGTWHNWTNKHLLRRMRVQKVVCFFLVKETNHEHSKQTTYMYTNNTTNNLFIRKQRKCWGNEVANEMKCCWVYFSEEK